MLTDADKHILDKEEMEEEEEEEEEEATCTVYSYYKNITFCITKVVESFQ